MNTFDTGENVIRRIEELIDFDISLNHLYPKEIILGRAAWRALRLHHLFYYGHRPPEKFTFNDIPVTSLPPGRDEWHVEVRSASVEAGQ